MISPRIEQLSRRWDKETQQLFLEKVKAEELCERFDLVKVTKIGDCWWGTRGGRPEDWFQIKL